MTSEGSQLVLRSPDVPRLDSFVDRACRNHTVIVLAPICCQDLIGMSCDAEGGSVLPQIPDLGRAVARTAQEDICMCGIPAYNNSSITILQVYAYKVSLKSLSDCPHATLHQRRDPFQLDKVQTPGLNKS